MKTRPAEQLANIGQSLYGEHWQKMLANDLRIRRDTIRHWLSGKNDLPADHSVFTDLSRILDDHIRCLETTRADLKQWERWREAAAKAVATRRRNQELAVKRREAAAKAVATRRRNQELAEHRVPQIVG